MKKYIVFLISFFLLYIVLQILSGLFLTAFYTPSLSLHNGTLSQEVAFGQHSTFLLLQMLLIATVAYFVSQTAYRKTKKITTNEECYHKVFFFGNTPKKVYRFPISKDSPSIHQTNFWDILLVIGFCNITLLTLSFEKIRFKKRLYSDFL